MTRVVLLCLQLEPPDPHAISSSSEFQLYGRANWIGCELVSSIQGGVFKSEVPASTQTAELHPKPLLATGVHTKICIRN